jgi:hypothetical protein
LLRLDFDTVIPENLNSICYTEWPIHCSDRDSVLFLFRMEERVALDFLYLRLAKNLIKSFIQQRETATSIKQTGGLPATIPPVSHQMTNSSFIVTGVVQLNRDVYAGPAAIQSWTITRLVLSSWCWFYKARPRSNPADGQSASLFVESLSESPSISSGSSE